MFEGSAEDLLLTENAQPALMAVSMAVVRVLQQEGKISLAETFKYAAGHSWANIRLCVLPARLT